MGGNGKMDAVGRAFVLEAAGCHNVAYMAGGLRRHQAKKHGSVKIPHVPREAV